MSEESVVSQRVETSINGYPALGSGCYNVSIAEWEAGGRARVRRVVFLLVPRPTEMFVKHALATRTGRIC